MEAQSSIYCEKLRSKKQQNLHDRVTCPMKINLPTPRLLANSSVGIGIGLWHNNTAIRVLMMP